MVKRCIACKREISLGQSNCYICGASQSYFRYYLKSGSLFVLMIGAITGTSYWYIEQSILKMELAQNLRLSAKTTQSEVKIDELEKQLVQAHQENGEVVTKLAKVEEKTLQSNQTASQADIKLQDSVKRAIKAEQRASWLSKENRRIKAENKTLTDKLALLDKSQSIQQAIEIDNKGLNQELTKYQREKQVLIDDITNKTEQKIR